MMSRLAGRAIERTDEDYDLDDVFTSRASRKDGKAEEEREREKAIAEHQRERRWVVLYCIAGCVSGMGWFNQGPTISEKNGCRLRFGGPVL